MSDDTIMRFPHPGGTDPASLSIYGRNDPFDHPYYRCCCRDPEVDAYWESLSLKQKIVGSLCSIAVGAAGAGLLIALVTYLH